MLGFDLQPSCPLGRLVVGGADHFNTHHMLGISGMANPSFETKDPHLVSITQGGLEGAPQNTKDSPNQEVSRVSEALCQELVTKTRSILVYLTVGICGSNQTLSGYMKLTPLDFQVS